MSSYNLAVSPSWLDGATMQCSVTANGASPLSFRRGLKQPEVNANSPVGVCADVGELMAQLKAQLGVAPEADLTAMVLDTDFDEEVALVDLDELEPNAEVKLLCKDAGGPPLAPAVAAASASPAPAQAAVVSYTKVAPAPMPGTPPPVLRSRARR